MSTQPIASVSPAASPAVPAVTRQLAEFAASSADLSSGTRHAARMTVANILGLMIGGTTTDAFRVARGTFASPDLPAQSTIWGHRDHTSMTVAALLGGIAAHVEDFDDTHLRTVIHPGAPVVPAALAVGEYVGATLGQVVEAVALGVEITLRVGVGLGQTHFARGWHITGSTGRLGAAAAAGRILGLDPGQLRAALGIASTQPAGLQAAFGTMTKSFHAGKAAYDGVEAALLASTGFTSAAMAIEGRRGLAATASDDADPAAMVADLGSSWEVLSNAIKPYACGIVSHPVIDAGIELRRSGIRAADVSAAHLRVNPVVLDVMGVTDPADGLQSKFSVYHCFAVGLADGAGGPEQFSDSRARDPEITELRRRIAVELDPSVARDECFAEVYGPRPGSCHVEHATASKDRPMTITQLREKIELLTAPVLGVEKAVDLANIALEDGDDLLIRDLAKTATGDN